MDRPVHTVHRQFIMQPDMKGNLRDHVTAALLGAKYHLGKIDKAISNPYFEASLFIEKEGTAEDKAKVEQARNLMHWHLRGFFWELVATFDTLLQWANIEYGLGLKEDQIRPSAIRKKASINMEEWKAKYQVIERAWLSDWLSGRCVRAGVVLKLFL